MKVKIPPTQIRSLLLVLLAFRGFAIDNDLNEKWEPQYESRESDYESGDFLYQYPSREFLYRFISREQVEVSQGTTITHILTYHDCIYYADYSFAVFTNPKNEEIYMNIGPNLDEFFSWSDTNYTDFTIGEEVEVTWELVTLSCAGSGEVPYYFWSMVNIEKIDE